MLTSKKTKQHIIEEENPLCPTYLIPVSCNVIKSITLTSIADDRSGVAHGSLRSTVPFHGRQFKYRYLKIGK